MDGVSEWPAFGGDRQRSGRSPSPDAEGAAGNLIWDRDRRFGPVLPGAVVPPRLELPAADLLLQEVELVHPIPGDDLERLEEPAGPALPAVLHRFVDSGVDAAAGSGCDGKTAPAGD